MKNSIEYLKKSYQFEFWLLYFLAAEETQNFTFDSTKINCALLITLELCVSPYLFQFASKMAFWHNIVMEVNHNQNSTYLFRLSAKSQAVARSSNHCGRIRQAILALSVAKHGFDIDRIADALGISRHTVFRDRDDLRPQDYSCKNNKGGRRKAVMTIDEKRVPQQNLWVTLGVGSSPNP